MFFKLVSICLFEIFQLAIFFYFLLTLLLPNAYHIAKYKTYHQMTLDHFCDVSRYA